MLASHITSLLHFPGSFIQIAPLIVLLSLNLPFVALDMLLGTILIANGRQKAWTCVGIVACVLNPLANLWAIPFTQRMYGDGAIGASLTTIMAEVIMLVGALFLRPKHIFTRWDVFYIFRCLIAAVIMIPAVAVFAGSSSNVALVFSICYGVLIYGLACYALRVLTTEDLVGAVHVLTGKLGLGGLSVARISGVLALGGLRFTRMRGRERVERAHAAVSRPLGMVSRPLTKALAAVSQPLAQASASIGTVANRYRNSPTWTDSECAAERLHGDEAPALVHAHALQQPDQASAVAVDEDR
jgi:hypothetical protein